MCGGGQKRAMAVVEGVVVGGDVRNPPMSHEDSLVVVGGMVVHIESHQ